MPMTRDADDSVAVKFNQPRIASKAILDYKHDPLKKTRTINESFTPGMSGNYILRINLHGLVMSSGMASAAVKLRMASCGDYILK